MAFQRQHLAAPSALHVSVGATGTTVRTSGELNASQIEELIVLLTAALPLAQEREDYLRRTGATDRALSFTDLPI